MLSKVVSTLVLGALTLSQVSAQSTATPPKFQYGTPSANYPGVVAKNANGPTNPQSPQLGTPINQTSDARLVTVNSVDDWCLFGPDVSKVIADIEGETVAWCTKARNNARVIPDGTITAAHFVKTPLYIQVMALGDFTKIMVVPGDEGGELDPHGATNLGNPIGGNVTSNISGTDVFYEEWMSYISYNEFCIRVCIAGSDIAPTPLECQHTIDELGCEWVMPGDYTDNVFDTCEADAAYPPGLFPNADNTGTSTFQQYYSSVYTDPSGGLHTFVNGSPDETTPSAAYSTPASSSCSTTNTIANGIASLAAAASSSAAATQSSGVTTTKKSDSHQTGASANSGSNSSGSQNAAAGSSGSSGAMSLVPGAAFASVMALVAAAFAL